MFKTYRILIIIFCITFSFNCKTNEKNKNKLHQEKKWVKLFNGKDLKNWICKINGQAVGVNYNNTFTVENEILKVNYNSYNDTFNESYGHLFYDKVFSNYKLKLQYRFTGEQLKDGPEWAIRNSGVMIHCENPKNMGINQKFPVCIEVQLLGGLGTGERSTGNLCTPGTHIKINNALNTLHCIDSSSKTYHGEQWVNLEIEVRNDSIIKHYINGDLVMSYTNPQIGGDVDYNQDYWKSKIGSPLKNGYISLQSESHPVEFKNIEILEL